MFLLRLGSQALLTVEMERDYDQIRLIIGSDTTEPAVLVIHRPDRIFLKPIYLYVGRKHDEQVIAFVCQHRSGHLAGVGLNQQQR